MILQVNLSQKTRSWVTVVLEVIDAHTQERKRWRKQLACQKVCQGIGTHCERQRLINIFDLGFKLSRGSVI